MCWVILIEIGVHSFLIIFQTPTEKKLSPHLTINLSALDPNPFPTPIPHPLPTPYTF